MTWVKLDDSLPDHPKIIRLSDAAFRAYITGLCYCGKYLTDGGIPGPLALRFAGKRAVLQELVHALLWIPMGEDFAVNGFLEYNPTRQQVEAERKAARERRSKRGGRSKDGTATVARPSPEPPPDVPTTSIDPGLGLDPEELQHLSSAAPRDDVENDTQAYLLGRLRGRYESFREEHLTAAAIAKLNQDWTPEIVTWALQELHGYPRDDITDAYGLLFVMCRGRALEATSA